MEFPTHSLHDLQDRPGAQLNPKTVRAWAAQQCLGRVGLETPSALIAGTNGKGSTAGMLWHILGGTALRCGLLTSPHIVNFRERFRISDQPISDDDAQLALRRMQSGLPAEIFSCLSGYETATLLGLYLFRQAQCDFNVIEVGIGGQNDATNIVNPDVSLITSIGNDHADVLGDTDDRIAAQKAGVMRAGRPALWGGEEAGSPLAVSTLRDIAAALGSPFYEYGRHFYIDSSEVKLALPGRDKTAYPLPLYIQESAEFLRRNFAMAVAASAIILERWFEKPFALLSGTLQKFAAEGTPRPPTLWGRFQLVEIQQNPGTLLLDVCHNVHGATAFRKELQRKYHANGERKLPGLVSILKDKDIAGVLAELKQVLSPIVLFQLPHERTFSLEDLAKISEAHGLILFNSFDEAWQFAQATFPQEAPWVACGSVKAVGLLMKSLSVPLSEHYP